MNESDFSELHKLADSSPESKLIMLRSELRRHILVISGYSQIIQNKIQSGEIENLPPDVEVWINKIFTASREMDEIIEILTTKRS